MSDQRAVIGASLGAATVFFILIVSAPAAGAQCEYARAFATVGGGPSAVQMRVDPTGTNGVLGLEYGRFWQCDSSDDGNNFIPGDPQKKMTPAGTGGCASRDPLDPWGGFWQITFTTHRGVNGLIGSMACTASSCPEGDLCTVVEEWGPNGPPGTDAGATAFFVGWRSDPTPPEFRWWNLGKFCGSPGMDCKVPFHEFPLPLVTSDSPPGNFTVRSNRDPGENVYVFNPDTGPASELIHSYDIMVHYGESEPGRDRNASCDGSPCWDLVEQVPYEDSALAATPIVVACDQPGPETTFVALGFSFVGGSPGGPVPSQLVGRSIELECVCDDLDGDGAGCGDCDDTDPEIFPGADETCDGEDDDCDGLIDFDDPGMLPVETWYLDADGDGFGDPDQALPECTEPPSGYVTRGNDCDDLDPTVYPGAEQVCDGVNNNCNHWKWPELTFTNEMDDDGDSLSECEGDCDDYAASIWATPGEATDLTLADRAPGPWPPDSTELAWDASTGGTAESMEYDTLRSNAPDDFVAGVACVESDDGPDTTSLDTASPQPTGVFFYLVRAENACPVGQGSLGAGLDGQERSGRDCP